MIESGSNLRTEAKSKKNKSQARTKSKKYNKTANKLESIKKLLNFFKKGGGNSSNHNTESSNNSDVSSSEKSKKKENPASSSSFSLNQQNVELFDKKEFLELLKNIKDEDPCNDEELKNLLEHTRFFVEKYTEKKTDKKTSQLKQADYYLGYEVIAELFLAIRKVSVANLGAKVPRGAQFNPKITKSISRYDGGSFLKLILKTIVKVSESLKKKSLETPNHKRTVLINALSALWVLTRSDDIIRSISNLDGIPVLLETCSSNLADRDVVIPLLASLGNLTSDNHEKFDSQDFLIKLSEIYKTHKLDAQVIEKYALIVMNCSVTNSFKTLFFDNGKGFGVLWEIVQRFIAIDLKFSLFFDGLESNIEKETIDDEFDALIDDPIIRSRKDGKKHENSSSELSTLEKTKFEVCISREKEYFQNRKELIPQSRMDVAIMVFGAIRNLLHKSSVNVKYFLKDDGIVILKSVLFQTRNSDVVEQIVASLRNISVYSPQKSNITMEFSESAGVDIKIASILHTILLVTEEYFPPCIAEIGRRSLRESQSSLFERLNPNNDIHAAYQGLLLQLQQQQQILQQQLLQQPPIQIIEIAKNAEEVIDHSLCCIRNFYSPRNAQIFALAKGIERVLDLLELTLTETQKADEYGEELEAEADQRSRRRRNFNLQILETQNELLTVLFFYCKSTMCSDDLIIKDGFAVIKRVKAATSHFDSEKPLSDACLMRATDALLSKWTNLVSLILKSTQESPFIQEVELPYIC